MKNLFFVLFLNNINSIFITPINNITAEKNSLLSGSMLEVTGDIYCNNDITINNKSIIFQKNFIINSTQLTLELKTLILDNTNLNQFLVLNSNQEVEKLTQIDPFSYTTCQVNSINSPQGTDLTFNSFDTNNQIIIDNQNGILLCSSPINTDEIYNTTINKNIIINNLTYFENISCNNYASTDSKTTINSPLTINSINQFTCNLIKSVNTNNITLPNLVCQGTINLGSNDLTVNNSNITIFINESSTNSENFLALDTENRLSSTNTYPVNIKTKVLSSTGNELTINNINEINAFGIGPTTLNVEIKPLNQNNLILYFDVRTSILYCKQIFINNAAYCYNINSLSYYLTNNNDIAIPVIGVINDDNLPIDFSFRSSHTLTEYIVPNGAYNIYLSGNSNIFNNVITSSVYLNFLVSQQPNVDSFALINIKNVIQYINEKKKTASDLLSLYKNITTIQQKLNTENILYNTLIKKKKKLIIIERDIDKDIDKIKKGEL